MNAPAQTHVLFGAVTARMISSQALVSAVPDLADRGTFMSVNGSIAQLSGGVAAAVAGLIVMQRPGQPLERYDVIWSVVAGAGLLTIVLMHQVHKMVSAKLAEDGPDTRRVPRSTQFAIDGGQKTMRRLKCRLPLAPRN